MSQYRQVPFLAHNYDDDQHLEHSVAFDQMLVE